MASLNPVVRQVDPELRAIRKWLQRKGNDHFLVTSHVNPDGDGLASMLACGGILRSLGKQVWLVADGFGGGGHRKAAGARWSGTLEEVKARLVSEIQRRLEALNERSA